MTNTNKVNFKFNKKSIYSKAEIHKIVTNSDDRPNFDFDRTGYGTAKGNDDDLFIFANIGIPGRTGEDYKNVYSEETESLTWCAKRNTSSGQPRMKKIINGELNLYFFARWVKNEKWTYIGKGTVLDYKDGAKVADKDGSDAECMEYKITFLETEEEKLDNTDIENGVLSESSEKPKKRKKRNNQKKFKGKKGINWLLSNKRNKKIGEIGEKLVLGFEEKRLNDSGLPNLANSIEHTSEIEGDGAGYDIKSFNTDGSVRYIEVKTTKEAVNSDFFLTENELEFANLNKNNFYIYRVFNLKTHPSIEAEVYIYQEELEEVFNIDPIQFRVYPK